MDESKKRYFVKKPTGRRKSYVLICYVLVDRQTKRYVQLAPALKEQVDRINAQLRTGTIQGHEVETLLKDVVEKQYRKFKVQARALRDSKLSEINQKIFNSFWSDVYGIRELDDAASARYDVLKALRLIEPLSLATASAQELQERLRNSATKVSERRRAVDRLNQVLRFLQRDLVLQKPKDGVHVIQYVTEAELKRLLPFIEDATLRDLAVVLFCSGLRMSEALALTPEDFVNGQISVTKQLSRLGVVKLPKRQKTGKAVVLSFGAKAIQRWCEVEDKQPYRYRLFDELERACRKAFPSNKNKWIGPHDLRHSHAIYLLGKGASLTQVALNLRNRVDVCQKYYTGFAHSDETVEALKKVIE